LQVTATATLRQQKLTLTLYFNCTCSHNDTSTAHATKQRTGTGSILPFKSRGAQSRENNVTYQLQKSSSYMVIFVYLFLSFIHGGAQL